MVNIVIPVYKGVDFLSIPLDSLLKQTDRDFIVTIVQDFDELDYTQIIQLYKEKGLTIDHIQLPVRFKQGRARQIGMDSHSECDYVMFLDQDDSLMPYSIQILQGKIRSTESDLVISKFIKEKKDGSIEVVGRGHPEVLTQHHGKIYSMAYLAKYKIQFIQGIDFAEDSSFNMQAYYCADKATYTDYVTYKWNYNPNSESRDKDSEYYQGMLGDFITGQVAALLHILRYMPNLQTDVLLTSISNFYEIAMIMRQCNYPERQSRESLTYLGKNARVKELLRDKSVIAYFAKNIKGGTTHTGTPMFFNYSFMDWVDEWLDSEEEVNNEQ